VQLNDLYRLKSHKTKEDVYFTNSALSFVLHISLRPSFYFVQLQIFHLTRRRFASKEDDHTWLGFICSNRQ
jgi:hypothetical protein